MLHIMFHHWTNLSNEKRDQFEIMKNAKHDEYDTKMKDKTHKWQNWMISNNSNDVSEFIYVIIHNTRARK